MNPLTNVKNIQKLGQKELELGLVGKKSWHDQYKDSAWIFVGGLPYDLTEGDVICVFSQYGEVVNINLVRDKKTGQSLGYGFLCYEDQRSTVLAVDNLNSIKILNRTIRVDHVENYRQPKDTGEESNTVKKLRIEGCAPKIQDSSSSEEGEVKDSPPSPPKRTKKDKLERKIRKKSKKRKKKKSDSKREDSDDSSSKSSSNSQVGASSGAYVSDVEPSNRGHAESPNSTMSKYPQHPVTSRRTNNNNNNLNTKAPFCPKRKYNDCNEKYDSKSRFVASSSSNTYGDAGNRVRPQDNRFDGRREYSRNNNDRFTNSWSNRFDGVRHPTTYGVRSPHKERQEFRDYEEDEYREDVRESDRVSRYSTRGENYRGREDVYARRESGYGRGTYPSRGGGAYVQREGGYPPREGGTGLLRDPVFPPRDPNYAHRGGEAGFPQRDSNYQPRNSGYSQRDDNYPRDNRHGKRDESYSQRDGRFQSRDTGYVQREPTNYRHRSTVYVERERVYPQRDRNYTERIRTGTERSRNYSDGPSTDHVRVGGEDYRRERSYRLSDDSRERNYNRKPEYDRDRKRSDRPYERRER
ncbi:RNA-binding motif protein, X-linked 2 isoform X1 [Octopus sinensis]|uniref:RNA-binding motif protein, X-linked 2 n=1 Tax=Octopus sinensis TaxID=2607531 RepID=A0A6P7TQH3_9MOLL|nr:RNA-binding motif protein, X-linked 2 isoform X1 [Octopus sinensis]